MSTAVDMRCPVNPSRLLGRVRDPNWNVQIVEGNLVEIACDHCKRTRRDRGERVATVLHRYSVLGEHIEDEVIRG